MLSRIVGGAILCVASGLALGQNVVTPNPILFVTQFPIPVDFGTIGSVFANHRADIDITGRGGDLYIRYGDGTLCNLTRTEGYGTAAVRQDANAIAVRDPHVHWSGTKAVFSMVVGAPVTAGQSREDYWQLYEVSGFGTCDANTLQITKVPNQPTRFNNVMPAYASDGQIIFVSDRSRTGERHLFPLLDEYESAHTNSGLWKLNPANGALVLLQYSPSGSFDPFVDSYGRVVFTRWDHLMRDQQAATPSFGTFNYTSEAASSTPTTSRAEVFPEPRLDGPGLNKLAINHFFPWQVNQDGTDEETLNHLGRQELHRYFTRSFTNDPNLHDFEYSTSGRTNPREAFNYLQIHEDRLNPGRYYAVDAPEFGTQNAGQIISLEAQPSRNPDDVVVNFVTHYETRSTDENSDDNSGHYRNPIVLGDGALIASHVPNRGTAGNDGSFEMPRSRYQFRLRKLVPGPGGYLVAGASLTQGLSRAIEYFSGGGGPLVSYSGPLWELSPVEVVARPAPPASAAATRAPEAAAYQQTGVAQAEFESYLRQRNLAVMVVRDTTARDDAEKQQPFNLRVPGGRQTPANPVGRVYDIAHFQVYQGDQLRGMYRGNANPIAGRRVIAQAMHDGAALRANIPNPGGPAGSVAIASDGSAAVVVPASRALAWQSTAPDGTPVVRERFWITLQPGEVRACDGCHGVNRVSQGGQPASQQTAQAFIDLLENYKRRPLFADGFED